jgi:exonuclease III
MNWVIWNIRGLNHPLKQREVRKMVKWLDLSLICLVETRVRLENTHEVRESILPGWEFVFCCSDNGLGKIWLFWKKDVGPSCLPETPSGNSL